MLLFLERPSLLPWSVARANVDRKPGLSAWTGALSLATTGTQKQWQRWISRHWPSRTTMDQCGSPSLWGCRQAWYDRKGCVYIIWPEISMRIDGWQCLTFDNWDTIPVCHYNSMKTFNTGGGEQTVFFLLQWLNTTHYELTPQPHQHVTSCIHTSAAVCTGISSNPAKKTSFLLRFSRKLCAARTLYTPHICDFLFVFLKYKHFIMCFSLRDREGQGWPLRERQKDRQTVRETDRPHSHQPWWPVFCRVLQTAELLWRENRLR